MIDILPSSDHVEIKILISLPFVYGNEVQVRHIFRNLVGNALKYNDKEHGTVEISSRRQNGSWEFSISDNGPGVKEQYHSKIFQMFETVPGRGYQNGTGIGLALVKKIVKSYGGKVWLKSKVGEGSTFFFTLPRTLRT
ncbi:MAG: GHKL domain-containing protein [Bacteroidetes bacterium]|nr:GHKL domain-containing protein [Bacteroidota bacterium]